jgi:opacity protein-like surface antigen
MKKFLTMAALALGATLPVTAQNWSLGVHSGPFVFGDLVERRTRPSTGEGSSGTVTLTLSAATRAGLAVDLERELAPRWALRIEGAFTRAPLSVEEEGDDVSLEAGEADIATFAVPLVFRINPRGSFRIHLMGGPAYVVYRISGKEESFSGIPVDDITRSRWGILGGAGIAWWTSDRFAVEGNISDTVTSSPFERGDFAGTGWDLPRTHNVHTTVGVRWRF